MSDSRAPTDDSQTIGAADRPAGYNVFSASDLTLDSDGDRPPVSARVDQRRYREAA